MIRALAVGSMLLVLGCGSSGNGGATGGTGGSGGGTGNGGATGGTDAGTTGAKTFSAAVDGTQTAFSNNLVVYNHINIVDIPGEKNIIEIQGKGNGMLLQLFLPFTAPGTYSCDPGDPSSKEIVLSDAMAMYDTWGGACTITVEINEQRPGGRLKGTFAGTIANPTTSKAITAGSFDVSLPAGA